MAVITIPKKLTREGELVVMPRREYEEYLRFRINGKKRPSKRLDRSLRKSLEELRQGKAVGPFNNVKDLMGSLRASK